MCLLAGNYYCWFSHRLSSILHLRGRYSSQSIPFYDGSDAPSCHICGSDIRSFSIESNACNILASRLIPGISTSAIVQIVGIFPYSLCRWKGSKRTCSNISYLPLNRLRNPALALPWISTTHWDRLSCRMGGSNKRSQHGQWRHLCRYGRC